MIKKLLGCVREYKTNAILTPTFVMIEVVVDVIIPILMARLIDQGIETGDLNQTLIIGLWLVLCCLVSLFFGAMSARSGSVASIGFAKNVRHDMFHNIQNYSFRNIDKFSTSSIVTRLTTDVTNIQNAFQMSLRMAVRAPFMIVFAIIMASTISWKLSLIYIAVIPILGGALLLIIKNARPIFERIFKIYDKLNLVVGENLHGIRVVKSYVREEHEKEKFHDASDMLRSLQTKVQKILALNNPIMQTCLYTSMLLIAWFGAKIIIGGDMSTGELMSMITYAMQILNNLMMLSMVFVMIIMSQASAGRIVEVLDEKSDITNPENPVQKVANGSLDFDNVGFSYANDKDKQCLSDVNIHIKEGEFVGILGATGSAKSSLVQLIPRLYDTTTGSVKVGGVDVKNYDLTALRDEVSVVLQKNVLFSGTIKENLRWGDSNATDEQLVRVCKLAQADSFINEFPDGYDTYIEQGGNNVSGGQKQRLCIARALLKKPKILILDDSTSAVDTKTDALIRNAFKNEIPSTTKIIIAQRVSSIQDADKIIVLDFGKVVATGTHDELMKSCSIYKEVYTSQNKGGKME